MRGTGKYTRAQLSDEIDKLKISGGVNGLGASMQTTRANLIAAIKLTAHVMRDPSFPESEFEQLRKQTLTGIEAQKSDPQALASVALSKHFNIWPKGDVRYARSLEEAEVDVKAVTLEQLRAYHKRFYAAQAGQIAVVGDFDEGEVIQTVKEVFSDWRGGVPYQRLTAPYRDVPPRVLRVETPDKENAMFIARLNIDMRDDDPDYPALYLANWIMGGGAGFDSRLTARIRVKEGLSYGAGSQLNVGPMDRGADWTVFAIAAPQNVEKVEAAFKDEVVKAHKDGFNLIEVASAKSGAMQARLQTRAQDGSLAGGIAGNLYLGRTYAWSEDFEKRLQAVKVEEVTAAFRKHIDPAKFTIVKAGDFAKAAKAPEELQKK